MAIALVPPTLQDLIRVERNMLNQPDPNNSFWSDEELTDYNNEAVRIHMAELADIDEGQFTTTAVLDIVNGAETVALPSDFFMAKALYRVLNQRNIKLSYDNSSPSYPTGNSSSGENYIPDYYFRGNNLVLRMAPTFAETGGLLLEYMQYPMTLLDPTDTVSAQIDALFRQSLEAYVVYKAKLKESLVSNVTVHAVAEDHWGKLFRQFKDLSAKRSRKTTSVVPFDPDL